MSTFIEPNASAQSTVTSGTFSLISNTTEQTILTLTTDGNSYRFAMWLDTSSLTKNNTRIFTYVKIDAVNYRLYSTQTLAAAQPCNYIPEFDQSFDVKITMQSAVAEGATRSIPYIYFLNKI